MSDPILKIQSKLKAPKNQHNDFGGYNYRSCEDILEALKPHLKEEGLRQIISDEVVCIGDRVYIKATVTVKKDGEVLETADGYAREAQSKKGMDDSQITGSASSYARKYALNGLWLIDDVKDADTNSHQREKNQRQTSKNGSSDDKEWLNKTEYKSDELTDEWKKVLKRLKSNPADLDKVFGHYKVNTENRKELEAYAESVREDSLEKEIEDEDLPF